MAKYSGPRLIEAGRGRHALQTTEVETLTHEGASAWLKNAKTELFTLAVTSMTAEDTFYESAKTRDGRLVRLVEHLVVEDPGFIQKLVPWLRNTANMRSAPLVIAAEYALAGGPNKRAVVNSAMSRADEPAEFVGYWIGRTGSKTFPGGVQRGLADAVSRLYNEFSALKYDSARHAVRMGDVISLAHPVPKDKAQAALFVWLMDRRHGRDTNGELLVGNLPIVVSRMAMEGIVPEGRRQLMESSDWTQFSANAAVTWEYLSGWLPGGMDAAAWEAVIPQMGYMALLRNLRNFDERGIGDEAKSYVKSFLGDDDNILRSRQLPFRFWSAWNAAKGLAWGETLEHGLERSVLNIPDLPGTTLVLVDVSASMTGGSISAKSTVRASDVAALFGAAVFAKNYGKTRVAVFGQSNKDVTPKTRGSMLRNMEVFRQNHGVGHSTNLADAGRAQYKGEDRIVIFTDMQAHDGGVSGLAKYTHYFDLGGYGAMPDETRDGVFLYGGFTDATFRQMALHEMSRGSSWDAILG